MRKIWLIILPVVLLTAFRLTEFYPNSKSAPSNITAPEISAVPEQKEEKEIPPKEYNDKEAAELIGLLDSIHRLDLRACKENILRPIDSSFRAIKNLDITLSDEDFNRLKHYCDSGKINLAFAKRILPFKINDETVTKPDEELINKDSAIYLGICSFDSILSCHNEFAIKLGNPMNWSHEVYFFKGNRMVAYQKIFHKYGLHIRSFRDSEGKTVIYYKALYSSGTGMVQSNYFFYRYIGNKLIPVLNVTSEGHDCVLGPIYMRQLDAKIIREQPLTIQYSENVILGDKGQYPDIDTTILYQDSAVIVFNWDKKSKSFKAHDPSVSIDELLVDYFPYDSQNYSIFQDYYSKFKAILNGPKGKSRNNVLFTLSELKEREINK